MQCQYQPLPGPLNIRLLSFNPNTNPLDPISVQFHIVDLDSTSCPEYWGLSYAWDNPLPSHSPPDSLTTKHQILCNGQPFLVRQNLYDFLKRFGNGNRYYWIDAICINQDDIPERNAQVSIMVKIYSQAAGTFVWLGEEDDTAKRAWDMISKFANAKLKLGEDYSRKILYQPWKFNDNAFFDVMGMEPWSQEDWKALSDFYARSWFCRQWVVQEVLLANNVVVFCGNKGMDWVHFIAFTKLYIVTDDWGAGLQNLESGFHKAGTPPTIKSTNDFVGLINSQNEGPTKPATEILLKIGSDFRNSGERFHAFLLYIVHRLRGRAATNPADHVYAPLSLASRWKTDIESLPPINYALPLLDIYTKFSSYLMRIPRPMLLSLREDDTVRRLRELPSWVPDYSVECHTGAPLGIRKSYNACGTHFPRFDEKTYVVCQNRLHMRGIYLDSISEITDKIQKSASTESLLDLLRLAFRQDPLLTSNTHLESLMRTVCANIVEDHQNVSRDDIFQWFTRWFRLVSHNPTELAQFRESIGNVNPQDWERFWMFSPEFLSNKSILPPPDQQNTASAEAETWRNSPALTDFLRTFLQNRSRLALTRSRRALALTMLSAKLGDEIWILFNGRMPYVLRKIEGEERGYHFVGEAYVHGFMEGEIFSRDKVDGLDVNIEPVVLI